MRSIILAFALFLCSIFAGATACPTGYGFSYSLTIPAATSLGGSLTNFPMYFAGNGALKTTGNGGNVQSSTGLDVVWCDAASGGNLLPFELVPNTYTATTGAGEWWIQVPTVSTTTTQTIYARVGKAAATDQSCGPSGTNNCASNLWTGYLGVYHAGTSTTLSTVNSVGNVSGTNTNFSAQAGEINGAYGTGTGGKIDAGATLTASAYTLELWVSDSLWSANNLSMLLSNCNQTSNGAESYYYRTGNAIRMEVYNAGGASGAAFTFSPSNSVFYHIATTYNGSTASSVSSWAGYLNGTSQTMSMYSTTVASAAAATSNFLIGQAPGATSAAIQNALIDEVRVYNGALTADWIKADYLNQNAPTSFYGTFTGGAVSSGTKHKSVIL